jgi:ribosomal protein S3AE
MPKIQKKKFFEIDLPLLNEKVEAAANSIEELKDKTIKMDMTRHLRGKSVDLVFKVKLENSKATAHPKKLTLLPFFIKHMLHTGIDYVEDSFTAESLESHVAVKPFLITRKKVSRAVRKALRNSAKNWLIDYIKTKTDFELFNDILTNNLQKQLSLRLKKIYPLAICEIRIFEIKKSLAKQ